MLPELTFLDKDHTLKMRLDQRRLSTVYSFCPMPKNTQFRFAEIEVRRFAEEDRIVGFFRYESEQQAKKSPLLVIMAEITSSLYVYEKFLDVLNETADQSRVLTTDVNSDPMARFEKIVEQLNKAIAQFLQDEPTEISWKRLNIFVMEFSDGHVCLTGLGRLSNIFMQKQDDGSFKSFDLFGSLEQPPVPNAEKMFASVLCGPVNVGDMLFVGTNNFDRWRNDFRMIERLSSLPPVSAALEIKQDVERLELTEDFVGFLVSHVVLPPAHPRSSAVEPPEALALKTVEALHHQEQEMARVLGPTIAPGKKHDDAVQETPVAVNERGASRAFSSTSFSLVKVFAELKARIKQLFHKRSDPVSMNSLRGLNAGHGSFLSRQKKRLLLGGFAAFILLGSLGGWAYFSQRAKAKAELWQALYDQIADKKNRAEADLVYGNEARTRSQIDEAKSLLDGLEAKSNDQKQKKDELAKALDDVLYKLKRETTLSDPELIASLAADVPANSLAGIAMFNGKLVTIDQAAKQVLLIDPSSKSVTRTDLPADVGNVLSLATGNSGVFAITDSKALLLINASGNVAKEGIQSTRLTTPRDLAVYASRFYVLDSGSKMIWKYNPGGPGATAETEYLKQTSEDLTGARALAIDASVYVAFEDGTVKRYLSGTEESWKPVEIDPALDNAVSIWTTPDTDRVVIADQKNKRIVIFRKDGRLVAQLVSPSWNGPSFVSGNDKDKKLYIIDSNRLYKVDLP